jgi:hypothetical protein
LEIPSELEPVSATSLKTGKGVAYEYQASTIYLELEELIEYDAITIAFR